MDFFGRLVIKDTTFFQSYRISCLVLSLRIRFLGFIKSCISLLNLYSLVFYTRFTPFLPPPPPPVFRFPTCLYPPPVFLPVYIPPVFLPVYTPPPPVFLPVYPSPPRLPPNTHLPASLPQSPLSSLPAYNYRHRRLWGRGGLWPPVYHHPPPPVYPSPTPS